MKYSKKTFAIAVAFWLLLWQIVALAIDSRIILVSPLTVFVRFFELAITSDFWLAIAFSTLRIGVGFILSCIAAIALSALSARYRTVRVLLAPVLPAIKSIPVASFVILALFWFSPDNLAVFICFLIVFPILYTNLLQGIEATDRHLLEMAKVFRLPTCKTVRYIYVSQVKPYFIAGCKVGVGLSWKSGVAAEVIAASAGSLGYQLQQSKIYLATADLFAWTVAIVLISLLFERVVFKLLDLIFKGLEVI